MKSSNKFIKYIMQLYMEIALVKRFNKILNLFLQDFV